ncbi:MAG: gliding motility-associated C-terminal domain-containing protein [Bacteroidia bacterium]|nr:gliding motility-associated C-terminal domain-containing protein [Bacteroidia bacterium]
MNTRLKFFCGLILWFSFFPLVIANHFPVHSPAKVLCVNITSTQVVAADCNQANGSITVVHDGTAPFSYTWSHDSTLNTAVANNLVSGSYTVQISDAAGCSGQITITVGQVPLVLTGATTPDTCGAPNGTATVNVPPGQGQAPYTYLWDNNAGNQTTQTATGLRNGLYQVTVTDVNQCQGVQTFNVLTGNNGFSGVITQVQHPNCFGEADGSAVVLPAGGNGVYNYQWFHINTPGNILSTTASVSGLPPGLYVIRLTDPDGPRCIFNAAVTIRQPDSLVANLSAAPATGCRSGNGQAWVNPEGGTMPYSILWSTGSTNDTISNLQPDFYSVTVTDSLGCENTTEFLIRSATGPFFTVDTAQADNCGLGQGIAQVHITTGRAPYRVIWNTNSLQPSDTSLIAYNLFGTTSALYYATVIDADTCIQRVHFGMPGNTPLLLGAITSTPEYCELANGSATITLSGGTEPYSYQWTTSPVQTTPTATGLIGGLYKVTVKDSLFCDFTAEVNVEKEIGFSLEVTATDETCYGNNDGTATALTNGGKGPFTYLWTTAPPQESSRATGLGDGVYNVTVTDSEGCERSGFAIVGSEELIKANFKFQPDTLTPVVISGAGFTFINESEGGDNYLWDFGDGNFSTEYSPVHVYGDTGRFFVTLTVSNLSGVCTDEITYGPFIVVEDGVIHMPNAFTPNGDGFNDFLRVGGVFVEEFDFRIFNRWGEQVFSSTAIGDSWDGRMASGKFAPEGVYVYSLFATIPGENPIRQTGTITLLR